MINLNVYIIIYIRLIGLIEMLKAQLKDSNIHLLLGLIYLLFVLQGCLSIPLTDFDKITYTNLTRLKAETTQLVRSFDKKPLEKNQTAIEKTQINLQIAYEYEIGKGANNSNTIKQFEKLMGLFNQDVSDYQEVGPGAFGKSYFKESAEVLGQAFDIVIDTENTKNRG